MLTKRFLVIIAILAVSLGLGTFQTQAFQPAPQSEPPELYLDQISEMTGMLAVTQPLSPDCTFSEEYQVYLCSPPDPNQITSPDPSAREQAMGLLAVQGLLLVPDSANDRVMAFNPLTGNMVDPDFIPSDPTNLSTPKNAIFHPYRNSILVSDQIEDVVQEYSLNGSYLGVFAPAGGADTTILDNILGISLRPNGNLLVTVTGGTNQDSVAEFDGSGNYLGNFIANSSGGLDGPFDVYSRVADWLVPGINSDNVIRYDLTGALINPFVSPVAFPEQVAEAMNGNVLVANFSTPESGLLEYTQAGIFVALYDVITGLRGVYELPNGHLLISNGSGMYEIDRSNNLIDTKYSGSGSQYIELFRQNNIALVKTVGTDPSSCATKSVIAVEEGTPVYYCYEVTNTGSITFTLHDLDDSQFGNIFTGLAYDLAPTASLDTVSAGLTISTTINNTIVNTATWTSYNLGPTDVVSSTSSAIVYPASISCPAGYEEVMVESADFETFPPTGWTITNTTTNCSPPGVPDWTNTDPGVRGNLTGGAGSFAIADSDACGAGSVMNASMTTGALDFTDLLNPKLSFYTDYNDISNVSDVADVDVSLDGGATWINLLNWNQDMRGPRQEMVAFPGSGLSDVRLRWNYTNATWDWWWEVDDVVISACMPVADIQVDPSVISDTLGANQQVTNTLTISNSGALTLTWSILEGPAGRELTPHQPDMAPAGLIDIDLAVDDTVASVIDTSIPPNLPPISALSTSGLLYDNGPLVNCSGCGTGGADESQVQDVTLGMTDRGYNVSVLSGFRIADDFTVTDPGGWYIDHLVLFPYQGNGPLVSSITAVNLQIWDGPPDNPSSTIVWGDTTTNRLISTDWTGSYRVFQSTTGDTSRPIMNAEVAVGVSFPPGTYWLDWQVDGDPLYSGPWAPPITINGVTTTGNSLQYSGVWTPLLDGGTLAPQGMPFQLYGCGMDISWVNSSPVSGITDPGATSLLSVGFDSTGLFPGTYNANLCLVSNDYDQPLLSVPLTLTVQIDPQVSLVKTVGVDPLSCGTSNLITSTVGLDVTYCFTVSNTGNITLTDHTLVDDHLGAILTNLTYSLAPGASVFVTTTQYISATTFNTAIWTAASGAHTASDSAIATVFIPVADLALSKIASPDPVPTGGTLTYTLTVTNQGPDAANGIFITDTLPAGVTYVSSSPGCSHSAGMVICSIASLGNMQSAMINITVITPQSAGLITNTAVVSSSAGDPFPDNNTVALDTMVILPVHKIFLPVLLR